MAAESWLENDNVTNLASQLKKLNTGTLGDERKCNKLHRSGLIRLGSQMTMRAKKLSANKCQKKFLV